MSISCTGPWSMYEYSLTAFTSSEMREVALSISSTRRPTSSDALKRKRTSAIASAGKRPPISSSRAASNPASARLAAIDQASSTWRRSSQSPSACSRSLRSSASPWRRVASHSCSKRGSRALCSAVSGCWSSREFTSRRRVTASRRLSAARRAAAAGLLSSCASPAESLPSDISFSRCWSCRVFSRMRSDMIPTSRWPSSGKRSSISGNSVAANLAPRADDTARTGRGISLQPRVWQHS